MADTAHRLTDEKLEEMEKRLSAIYSRAEKEIQKTADEYFSKFAKQDEAKRKLLEQGKITEDEYTKWRKGKVMYGSRFTEMKEQCAKQLLNVNQIAIAYVNGELPEVYAINYNALESSVDGVGGYSFTLVDADTVRNLAVTDTSLLPYKEIDPAKDIPWNMKKINAETLQGILQGESMDKIAKRIMNVQTMNKDAAIRSARTIVTNAECKGRQDSYQRAKDDGIIIRKYWIATYDKRARDWHKEAGNKYNEDNAIEIDEFFVVDGEKMLHPGDAMHGASGHNLYNCRCSIASKVIGFKKAQVQKAMAEKQAETHSTFSDGEQASQFFGEKPPRSLRRENREEYDRLLEEYRQSSFGSWYNGLSGEETTSIGEYSGDGYSGINGLLRGHMTEKMVKAWDDVSSIGIREMVDHIDDSISRFELKKGIKVYRTCEKDVFESLSTQVGSKFVDDGFVSTTVLNKKVASGNVFMEIDVPPGTGRGAWINPLSGAADEEWEFLLQRGSVFEITDVSDVGDDIVVKMKWTGIEKKDIKFASREDVIDWQKKNGLYDETEEYRI